MYCYICKLSMLKHDSDLFLFLLRDSNDAPRIMQTCCKRVATTTYQDQCDCRFEYAHSCKKGNNCGIFIFICHGNGLTGILSFLDGVQKTSVHVHVMMEEFPCYLFSS